VTGGWTTPARGVPKEGRATVRRLPPSLNSLKKEGFRYVAPVADTHSPRRTGPQPLRVNL